MQCASPPFFSSWFHPATAFIPTIPRDSTDDPACRLWTNGTLTANQPLNYRPLGISSNFSFALVESERTETGYCNGHPVDLTGTSQPCKCCNQSPRAVRPPRSFLTRLESGANPGAVRCWTRSLARPKIACVKRDRVAMVAGICSTLCVVGSYRYLLTRARPWYRIDRNYAYCGYLFPRSCSTLI